MNTSLTQVWEMGKIYHMCRYSTEPGCTICFERKRCYSSLTKNMSLLLRICHHICQLSDGISEFWKEHHWRLCLWWSACERTQAVHITYSPAFHFNFVSDSDSYSIVFSDYLVDIREEFVWFVFLWILFCFCIFVLYWFVWLIMQNYMISLNVLI